MGNTGGLRAVPGAPGGRVLTIDGDGASIQCVRTAIKDREVIYGLKRNIEVQVIGPLVRCCIRDGWVGSQLAPAKKLPPIEVFGSFIVEDGSAL